MNEEVIETDAFLVPTPIPMPDDLSRQCELEWDLVVPELTRRGIVDASYQQEVRMLCDWLARYKKYSKLFDKMTPRSAQFAETFRILKESSVQFNVLAKKFGLTPADVYRLKGGLEPERPRPLQGVASRRRA